MRQPKWKQEFLTRVKTLPLGELAVETLQAAGGDDYDGCFTERGRFEFVVLRKELTSRLFEAGLLTEDEMQALAHYLARLP